MARALRIGFIGAGQMARHHLAAIQRLEPGARIVGVHDRVAARAAEFAALADIKSFASVRELFVEAQPDVIHICTPPTAHFEAADEALERGAHVYVEKPFALTTSDALALLELAEKRERLVCAGHQLLRDPAFEQLLERANRLGDIVQIDSHFAFRPTVPSRVGAKALAAQIIDILPHPLYTLIAALENFAPTCAVTLEWTSTSESDVQAVLRAGTIVGRLSVSLRARPIASSLTIVGTAGSSTCDFVRSIVIGAGNAGTEALEKVLNPIVEGMQLCSRTALSVGRRLTSGASYPGLAQLISAFYSAVREGSPSPVSPLHLLQVTRTLERLVGEIEDGVRARAFAADGRLRINQGPLVAVTGARGFLGARIARALPRVRGIGRTKPPDETDTAEWTTADLSEPLVPEALKGAEVVVHAAAETSGGFEAHQRNTIDATRNLLRGMYEAGVSRLVLVSSLSVLRPPSSPWERQDESTPRVDNPRPFGPYVWGKTLQEALVEEEAPRLGIRTRIVRPGALIDWSDPELPGLMGRRLFGRWHLGLGRSGLPIAVCDVERCADAIAWCASHFEEAPPVVNLFDPAALTRGSVVERLRRDGWTGRMVWVPITAVSFGLVTARAALALSRGRVPERLAAWSILRPRHFDGRVAATLLRAAHLNLPSAGIHA